MADRIDPKNFMVPKISQMSRGFDDAQRRFQEILSTKLGKYAPIGVKTLSHSGHKFIAEDVTAGIGLYADQIDAKLKGTPMAGLGVAFDRAAAENGINPLFLASLAIHESNYGKSRIAMDKNNLFGFKAYDQSPYVSAQGYSSYVESIDSVAKYLKENYLSPQGKYYNGSSVAAIGKRYATDPNWAKSIESIALTF